MRLQTKLRLIWASGLLLWVMSVGFPQPAFANMEWCTEGQCIQRCTNLGYFSGYCSYWQGVEVCKRM